MTSYSSRKAIVSQEVHLIISYKKDQSFKWDLLCQCNFDKINQYLANPLILVPPIFGCPLILCISVTPTTLRALLAQHDNNDREKAIYHISHTLVGYELNYTPMEKSFLIVVISTQKLCHYILGHIAHIISKIDPLKYMISKTTLTGHLENQIMLLSEFDI